MGKVVPLVCLLTFGIIGAWLIVTNGFPSAFDELEHISYAAFLQETGRFLPRFEAQRALVSTDLRQWTDRQNYLGHPSPFYVYESLFLDRTLPPDRAILLPRVASGALVLAGVAMSLWAGWRHFGRDKIALPVFCLGVALCPKLLAVAGQVTNDSLAFLAGALVYWGVSVGRGRAIVALGLMLALWSKPNAGLAVGALLGAFAVQFGAGGIGLLAAGAVGAVVGSAPYWFIVASYGSLVPVTVEQLSDVRQLDGFANYIPAFFVSIGSNWRFDAAFAWPPTASAVVAASLFWLMIACVMAVGVLACRGPRTVRTAMAVAGPVALAALLPVHLWFSATRLGFSLPAASFRYYLPLWPALMHALAYGIAETRLRWQRFGIVGVGAAILAIGWMSR